MNYLFGALFLILASCWYSLSSRDFNKLKGLQIHLWCCAQLPYSLQVGFKTELIGDRSLKNLHKEVLFLPLSPRGSNTQTFQSFLKKKYSKISDNTRNYALTFLYVRRNQAWRLYYNTYKSYPETLTRNLGRYLNYFSSALNRHPRKL